MMLFLLSWSAAAVSMLALGAQADTTEATDMGPAAFLWPPDRTWSAAWDNSAPCGSNAHIGNRTDFPLTNGDLALVIQDESFDVQISISYSNDPSSNNDFETLLSSSQIKDVDPGHECYSVPSAASNTTAGNNATFQIKYMSEYDTDGNETYYACADITYVADSDFTTDIPCFNVSVPDTTSTSAGSSATATSTSSSGAPTTSFASSGSSSGSLNSKLSGGDIAGIVVGVVGGVAIFSSIIFLMWRRQQRLEKALMAEIMARDVASDGKTGVSSVNSVPLRSI